MATVIDVPHAADPASHRAPRRQIPPAASAEEQRSLGRAARKDVPRSELGAWSPADDRPDPVELLQEQARDRLQDLVPIRYGRMLVSAFTFYRGAANVMAADLARAPSSGIYTWLCADAHLSNFGMFATPERRLVFDLNDFDEAYPGPFEWDVKRLVASLVVGSRDRAFSDDIAEQSAIAAAKSYRETMLALAAEPTLDAWYSRIDMQDVQAQLKEEHDKQLERSTDKAVRKAATRTNLGALEKFAEPVDGGYRIREAPPLIIRIDPAEKTPGGMLIADVLRDAYDQYAASIPTHMRVLLPSYRFADAARKVVGVGSVGTAAFMFLLLGPHNDPLFLQLKEAMPSVIERYTEPGVCGEKNGERVVTGQRLMQAASDQFLGWLRIDAVQRPYDFYLRQLRDWKASLDVETVRPEGLVKYAGLCGVALAHAHGRGGSMCAIAGYLGKSQTFDTAMSSFGFAYADQTVLDHAALAEAEADGRIVAEHGI
jgi:uncharacterized protein (DUF2252 family)